MRHAISRRALARCGVFAASAVLLSALAACSLTIPTDPDGTLDRIEGGILYAGASADPHLIWEEGGEAHGPIAEFVEEFASEHDADVTWEFGGEETLVTDLEARELDIVVGGITADTPWADRVGISRGYPGFDDLDREIVFLVPLGQNRLLSELERFADREVAK